MAVLLSDLNIKRNKENTQIRYCKGANIFDRLYKEKKITIRENLQLLVSTGF